MIQNPKTPSNPPKNIYLLTGEDEFRKKLALDRLKKRLLGEKVDVFNYEVYYAKDSSFTELIHSLETLPLTGAIKLVVLKEPELFSEEDKNMLALYIKNFHTDKVVLLLVSAKAGSPREKFFNTISIYAKVFDFPRLKPDEISSWIAAEFKARNKIINRNAAQLICDIAQQDTSRIFSAIEQLSTFALQKEKITDEMIEEFNGEAFPEVSIFKLLDAINEKDTSNSLRILKTVLRSESNPSQIIGLLSWHITRLIAVKKLLIGKRPRGEMLSYFRIGSYILDRLISQAKNFTLSELKKQLQALLDTDLMLKRSSVKGDFLLEMLVVKLSA